MEQTTKYSSSAWRRNRFWHLLLLVFGLGYAQSNESAVKNQSLTARYSMPVLEAYQANSFEKINDFYHYLNLLSATDDKALQEQIKESIYVFFEDRNIVINNILKEKNEQIPLSYLLADIAGKGMKFSIANEKPGSYFYSDSWYNNYTLLVTEKDKTTTLQIMQWVYLKPENKAFGQQQKTVLTVSLGAIE